MSAVMSCTHMLSASAQTSAIALALLVRLHRESSPPRRYKSVEAMPTLSLCSPAQRIMRALPARHMGDRQSVGGQVPSSSSPVRGGVYSRHTSLTTEACADHEQAESPEQLQAAMMPLVQLRQKARLRFQMSLLCH